MPVYQRFQGVVAARLAAFAAAWAIVVVAVAGAGASCLDPPRAGHPVTRALPDAFWRAHPAWADLPAMDRDLLARTAIATRDRRAAQGARVFQSSSPIAVAEVPAAPGVLFASDGVSPLTALRGAVNAALAETGERAVLGTGYRSYDEQLRQWPAHMARYLVRHRDALAAYVRNDLYTDEGVCAFRDLTGKLYGFPGYSNHQSGRAIDFRLHRPGAPLLTASTEAGAKQAWCSSAFFRWMIVHAREHGFVQEQIDEPWHWAFDPIAAKDPSRAGYVAPSCR